MEYPRKNILTHWAYACCNVHVHSSERGLLIVTCTYNVYLSILYTFNVSEIWISKPNIGNMDQLASCIFMLYTLYINNMYILSLRSKEKREIGNGEREIECFYIHGLWWSFWISKLIIMCDIFFNLNNENDYKYENRTRKNMTEWIVEM